MRHYLIVDDNHAFAENLAEIIRDQGNEATVEQRGAEAIARARATRFDALVTDMKMPVMGGAELVHKIRRVDPGIPAIVVSAYTGDDDLAGAKNEGILAVLPKPVPVETLLELLSVAKRDGLIALVEDDVALLDNLAESLRDRGFTALTASSAKDAERLGGIRPLAALVDLHLPGSPRGELLQELEQKYPGLPMAVITGYPTLTPQTCPHRIFEKPFETDKVLAWLEALHESRGTP